MTIKNPPAFPVSIAMNEGHQDSPTTWQYPGLSMRDYFAAKAMQSLITDSKINPHVKMVADIAYKFADAMLAERAKNG